MDSDKMATLLQRRMSFIIDAHEVDEFRRQIRRTFPHWREKRCVVMLRSDGGRIQLLAQGDYWFSSSEIMFVMELAELLTTKRCQVKQRAMERAEVAA